MPKPLTDVIFKDCPIRNILSRISDKWSLLVLYTLETHEGGVLRFSEIRRCIPDVSQKVLTSTLRTLETDGYVSRTIYPEVPPRVEYVLTPRAVSLLPLIENLISWAMDHSAEILRDRAANTVNS